MAKEQLKPKKGVVVTEINGIKYFKLQSNYPGDYTKNCGLLGTEIDENFYFLRSNDIDNVSVNNGILTLTRVDGDTLSADISMPYTFNFDEKTGKLIITDGNGDVQVLEGFVVEGKDVRVASDATLNGDGTKGNPLRISELEKTGTYTPANEFLDMAVYDYFELVCELLDEGTKVYHYEKRNKNQVPEDADVIEYSEKPTKDLNFESPHWIKVRKDINLPDASNLGAGYRIVTRESKDNFGLLYNYDGVKKIQAALDATGSLWRVPTRKDWALMLNAAEYCEEDRNHDTKCVNEWTGKNAGARAKATTLWRWSDRQEKGLPVAGEDSLPIAGTNKFTVYPLGYADGSRGAEDEDFDLEAFAKKSSFWSITPENCNGESCSSNIFTRTFAYDTRKVLQESSKPSSRMSIRLVKDFKPNQMDANEIENILGYDMPVVLITNDETGYSKLWTSINVGFSEEQYDGVYSKEWSAATGSERGHEIIYYINEWDGKEWHKKQMSEGDSIVLLDGGKDESGNTIYNHEWRIYSGETGPMLIDTAEAIKGEFQKEIDAINNRIDEEISARNAADEDLQEQINEEVLARTAAIEDLQEQINEEVDRATSAETELRQRIDGLQIVEIEPEDETILASYILCEGESGDSKGVVINIPRDKSIYSIQLGDMGDEFEFPYEGDPHRTEQPDNIITASTGHEAIRVIYHQEDGIYQMSLIDADAFLQFDEFKDGLESSSTETSVVIKVKIDEASDEYLTVSMDGVKLSGVKARFNELQEELDKVEKGAGLNEDGTYSPDVFSRFISGATSLKEADSILDEKLGVEIERATAAENSISGDVTTLSASTVSEITRLDGKIDAETARATEVEAELKENIDEVVENVAELSAATEAFSAQTVSELDRLDKQDIKSDDYTFRANGTEEEGNGLIINRKGGESPIIIAFDGNFGSGMPLAL